MKTIRQAVPVVLLLLTGLESLYAQTPGADETAIDAAVAQNLTTAPAAGKSQFTGTFTFQFQGGRSEQLTYNVDFIFAHATRRIALLRLDLEDNRSEFTSAPNTDRIVSDDNRTAMLTVLPRMKKNFSIIGIGAFRQDKPIHLDHRFSAQIGPYFEPLTSKQLSFAIAPLIGAGVQDNAATESESLLSLGAMQSLVWQVSKSANLDVYAAQHRNLDNGEDYMFLVNTSLTASVTKWLGLTLSHKYLMENVHPPTVNAVKNTVNAGIRVTLQ